MSSAMCRGGGASAARVGALPRYSQRKHGLRSIATQLPEKKWALKSSPDWA